MKIMNAITVFASYIQTLYITGDVKAIFTLGNYVHRQVGKQIIRSKTNKIFSRQKKPLYHV